MKSECILENLVWLVCRDTSRWNIKYKHNVTCDSYQLRPFSSVVHFEWAGPIISTNKDFLTNCLIFVFKFYHCWDNPSKKAIIETMFIISTFFRICAKYIQSQHDPRCSITTFSGPANQCSSKDIDRAWPFKCIRQGSSGPVFTYIGTSPSWVHKGNLYSICQHLL